MQHFLPVRKALFGAFLRVKFVFTLKLSIILLLALNAQDLRAQDGPEVIQEWEHIAERSTLVDIMTRVVKCTPQASAQVHVMVFNENSMDQTVTFTVKISDTKSNKSVEQTIENYAISLATMHQPDCGNSDYANLKLDIPDGYDLKALKITATFKED